MRPGSRSSPPRPAVIAGYIDCVHPDCTEPQRRLYVSSTPRDQDNEASKIRRFIRRHQHKKEEKRPEAR